MNTFDLRKASLGIGALIVIAVGIYFMGQASDQKEQVAKSALYQIETNYDTEEKALPESDRASGVTLDVDSKFPKTVAALQAMLTEKKAPSRVLFQASMKLGTMYLDHNQADKAVPAFQHLVDSASTNFQKASAHYLLGVAQERSNHTKEAEAAYESGLSANLEGLKGELYLGVVRTSLKLNEKDKAKLFLEKMNKEVPGSHSTELASQLVKGSST